MARTQSSTTAERILAAARLCFSTYGFHKTVMEDIAREAGVSRGSVYRHFPDKESVYRAVSGELTRVFLDEVERRTAAVEGLDAQMAEVARLTVQFVRDNPLNAAMARTDPDAFARAVTTDARGLVEMAVEVVTPLVVAARGRGEVRADVDARQGAEWLVRAVLSAVSTPSVTFDGDDPAEMEGFLGAFMVRGLD